MDGARSCRRLRRSFRSDTTSLSTCDQDVVMARMKVAYGVLNLIQSRTTFLTGKIAEGNAYKKQKMSQTCLDITRVERDYKLELDELWSAAENVHLKIAALKIFVFNILSHQISTENQLYFQMPVPLDFKKKLFELAAVSQKLNIQKKKEEDLRKTVKSNLDDLVELISCTGQTLEEVNNVQPHQSVQRRIKNQQRALKTKIAQAVTNCLLSQHNIDFEQQPDLLYLKLKWRSAVNTEF